MEARWLLRWRLPCSSDFSLSGLASIARDPVVLAALRESVVLYVLGKSRFRREPDHPPVPVFLWRVDAELARRGARFVAAFNELFDDDLAEPIAENADLLFEGAHEEHVIGRCACIGQTLPPTRYYHWAIRPGPDGRPTVEEFWDSELWTTERYSRGDRS